MPLAITVYVLSNRIIFFERLAVFCKIFYTSCPSATSAILHLFLQQFIFTSNPLFDTLFRSQEFRRILKQVFIYWVGNQVIANFFGIVWIIARGISRLNTLFVFTSIILILEKKFDPVAVAFLSMLCFPNQKLISEYRQPFGE